MGEKSGPVPWVTCVSDLSLRVYFQMLVRPLTVRLNSTVLPGHPRQGPGFPQIVTQRTIE